MLVVTSQNDPFFALGKWKRAFPCDKKENFLLQHCSPYQCPHTCIIWAQHYVDIMSCGVYLVPDGVTPTGTKDQPVVPVGDTNRDKTRVSTNDRGECRHYFVCVA